MQAPGRPTAKPNLSTGAENNQPRSLARVFLTIRKKQGPRVSGADMHTILARQPSKYRMPRDLNSNEPQPDGATKKPSRLETYKWEKATGQPSFAVLHRYALASQTFTGVLHLASLFYAHFRDAGLADDDATRRGHLDFIDAVADGLMAFALTAKGNAASFRSVRRQYRFGTDAEASRDVDVDKQRDAFINMLLDGFREAPAIKECDLSIDRGRSPATTRPAPTKRTTSRSKG